MHNNRTLFTILASLFFTSIFTCQTHSQQAVQRTEPTTGIISGKVVNESGQPLPGANVFIRPVGQLTQPRSTISNLDGNFQIDGLDLALYTVSALSPAYVAARIDPISLPVTYRVGDSVRIELIRGGVITGTVTNAAGEPVVGIRVRASMIRDVEGKPAFSVGERSTDDRGIYRIYGLLPGTYVVSAGGGSPGNFLSAFDQDAPTFSPGSTRKTAEEITVHSGEEVTADVRYRGEKGHSISGTLKLIGTVGASINLTSGGEGALLLNIFQPAASREFAISGLADGSYDLVAQETLTTGIAYPDIAFSDPQRITIKGADVTGIELIPKPLGSITGKISLIPSTIAGCQNKRRPLFQEMMVSTITNPKKGGGEQTAPLRLFTMSSPDKDGNFTLRNLRAGQYIFTARYFARYWYLQSIIIGSSQSGTTNQSAASSSKVDLGRNWASVTSGDRVKGLVIVLAEGAALVRGKVNAGEGVSLPEDLRVYFVPAERENTEDAFRYFVAPVANDGTFSAGNLGPGKYWILAQVSTQPELSTIEKLRLPSSLDTRAKLKVDAEAKKVGLELKPCDTVSSYELMLK